MSFRAISWALNQNVGNPTSKLVLVLLANYANECNECYPSQIHIAKRAGCSSRSVMTHIKKLEKSKYLMVIKTRKGIKLHNRYRLNIPKELCEKSSHNTNINKIKNKNFLAG